MAAPCDFFSRVKERFGFSCYGCKKRVVARFSVTLADDVEVCMNCFVFKSLEKKMVKFVVNDKVAMGHEQTVPQEPKKPFVDWCVENLIHASKCVELNCQQIDCRNMKEIYQHALKCDQRRNGCLTCRRLIVPCRLHAKYCEVKNCTVFLCKEVKRELCFPLIRNCRKLGSAVICDEVSIVPIKKDDGSWGVVLKNPRTIYHSNQKPATRSTVTPLQTSTDIACDNYEEDNIMTNEELTPSSKVCNCTTCDGLNPCVVCFDRYISPKLTKLKLNDYSAVFHPDEIYPEESKLCIINTTYTSYLAHAFACPHPDCQWPKCHSMKRILQHMKSCPQQQHIDRCFTCKKLVTFCYYHAKHCVEENCLVPFCLNLRIRWKIRELEVRIQEAKYIWKRNLSQRIASKSKSRKIYDLK